MEKSIKEIKSDLLDNIKVIDGELTSEIEAEYESTTGTFVGVYNLALNFEHKSPSKNKIKELFTEKVEALKLKKITKLQFIDEVEYLIKKMKDNYE